MINVIQEVDKKRFNKERKPKTLQYYLNLQVYLNIFKNYDKI
jgi:hypothetical protein